MILKRFLLGGCFVLLMSAVRAQVAAELKRQFETYQTNNLQEKIFVHTDKTTYLAGERIWFKLYVVDGFVNHPLDLSKVAYVEIIDAASKAVLQGKIKLADGSGNGSFLIPSLVSSGRYTLRAYTQWMKNTGPDYFFEQPLTVINTLKETVTTDTAKLFPVAIQFFPEGGNMVAGMPTKLGFKTFGGNKDLSCTGVIVNQKKDTVAKFNTLVFGMGHVAFTPVATDQYKAIVQFEDGTSLAKDLPVVYPNGLSMTLSDAGKDNVLISLKATRAFENQPVYLLAQSHNLLKSVQTVNIINGTANFIINKNDLAEGVSQLTIFDKNKQPVCERLYFKRPKSKLSMNLQADKSTYNQRDKINLQLTATENAKKAVATDASISVFLVDSLQNSSYNHIFNYLMLSSDLKGNINNPELYFDETNKDIDEATDNLMLTQGWRRFDWQTVLKQQQPFFDIVPEQEGMLVTGKVISKKTGQPASNITAYLTVPGKRFQYLNSISNYKGQILFSLKDFYGSNEIILQTDNTKDSLYIVETDNPFFAGSFLNKMAPFKLSAGLKNDLTARHVAMQVENTYNLQARKKTLAVLMPDTSAFYGEPGHSFYLDAYTRFTTMEEVIKEYVADVRVRKRGNDYTMEIMDRSTLSYYNRHPLVLIDGLPVFDMNKIVAFNPLTVRKLDVVSKKYYAGPAVYDGIVSYKTYEGDLGGYTLDPGAVVVKYDGLQQQREFYNPTYNTAEQKDSRIPDLRNVLYWNPSIRTNSTGSAATSFFTSDMPGKYAILIQGITKDGNAGSQLITIDVK